MSSDGPYFSGDKLSAVDIAFYPFAYRINLLLSYYRNFKLPEEDEVWERYHRWYNANLELPAFQETSSGHLNYDDRLIFIFPIVKAKGKLM